MSGPFATTNWSQVLAARDASSTAARQALAELCEVYWYPLYVFIRRQGCNPEDAKDLTQAYFAELLEKNYLKDVKRSAGRFRAFLKTSVKHFLSKEREKARTLKRGGATKFISVDAQEAETRYRVEPAERMTPEEIFERRWAMTLLERALAKLRLEFAEVGKNQEFERLQGFLTGDKPQTPYRRVAAELGTTEGAVKASVLRLRRRFGGLLREEVAETVVDMAEVDDEVRHLLRVVAPGPIKVH